MYSYKIIYSDGTKGYIKALNIIRALTIADKELSIVRDLNLVDNENTGERIILIYEYKKWPMINKIITIFKRNPKLKIVKK